MSQVQNNMTQTQQQAANSFFNQLQTAYKKNPAQTIAIGVGIAVVAPAVLPLVKPFAKAAIKSGVNFFEKTKGAIAETGEILGDIVAEAKAEAAMEQAKKVSLGAGIIATASSKQDSQGN